MVSNKKLFLQELKRNTWAIAVLFIGMITLKPVMLLTSFESNERWSIGVSLIQNMEMQILNNYSADVVITYGTAILLGLLGFGFVFSKSKVDMYHSIPVSRSRKFIINYAVGFTIYFVLYTVTTVFNVIVAASNHFLTVQAMKNFITVYAGSVIHFIYAYSLVIAAVMLTGNIVVCFAAILTLGLYYMLFTEMICAFMNKYFVTKTYFYEIGSAFWRKLPYISPVTSDWMYLLRQADRYNVTPFEGKLSIAVYLLKTLICAVLVLLAAYFLYQKRSSEAAGKALAFKASQPVVRIPLVILTGMFVGYMMLGITGSYESKWLWIGAVSGTILMHFTMEIIFNLNFKAFLKHKIQLIACLAVTLIIILIFEKDLLGYDKYIPDRDKIEAAGIYFQQLDTDMSYCDVVREADGLWHIKYKGSTDWSFKNLFTDESMIDDIYALSQLGVANIDDMKAERVRDRYGREYAMKKSFNAVNNYEMAEGSIIGEADGPTSVFIAGKTADDTVSAVFEGSDGPASVFAKGKEAKLELAKQYMQENNIIVSESDSEPRKALITVYYKLKNNSVILRAYSIPMPDFEPAFNDVYTKEEFKKDHYNLFDALDKDAIYAVRAEDTLHERKMTLEGDAAGEFLNIYKDELMTLTVDDLKQTPVGLITPLVKGEMYDEILSGYYIYPRFEKTLKFMKDIGVDMEYFTTDIDITKLSNMTVYSYDLFERVIDNEEQPDDTMNKIYQPVIWDNSTYLKENPEDMEIIQCAVPKLKIMSYGYSNSIFTNFDNRCDINVYYDLSNGMMKSHSCKFDADDMPKDVLDDLTIKMFEAETKVKDPLVDGYPEFQEYDPGDVYNAMP